MCDVTHKSGKSCMRHHRDTRTYYSDSPTMVVGFDSGTKHINTWAVQCSAVQCSAVQCGTVQCSAVQICTVHCKRVYRTNKTSVLNAAKESVGGPRLLDPGHEVKLRKEFGKFSFVYLVLCIYNVLQFSLRKSYSSAQLN